MTDERLDYTGSLQNTVDDTLREKISNVKVVICGKYLNKVTKT